MSQLQKITVNLDGSAVRDEILEGEEYWVAPLVMQTEGVANGSQGALFYPSDELMNAVPAWNHKAIVAPIHPPEGSANTKEFLDSHKIGLVLDAKWDGKQRAFGWFNKKRTKKIEPRVANALVSGRMMELSTGLYVDPEMTSGEFKGEKYIAIARNHRPDHLAILPDKIGACSIAKGAGLLQMNEASHEKIRNDLESLLVALYAEDMKKMPSLFQPYAIAIYDSYVVYRWAGNTYRINYSVSKDEKVSLVGDPTQVEQKVEYVPVSNSEDKHEEDTMAKNKKDLVDGLIKNSGGRFKEEDRKTLETLNEDMLEKLMPEPPKGNDGLPKTKEELEKAVTRQIEDLIANKSEEVIQKATAALAKKAPPPEKPPEVNLSPEQWMKAMPDAFKPIMNNAMESYRSEIARLVGVITSNKNNQAKPEDLAKLDINLLRNMAAVAAPPPEQSQTGAFPFLFAAPLPQMAMNTTTIKEEGMPVPLLDDSKFAAGLKK